MRSEVRPPALLLVEDSQEDHEQIARSLQKCGLCPWLVWCRDGDEALHYLATLAEEPQQRTRPALILLDLNLPGTDGREVLLRLKSDPNTKEIPVVVLTTSGDERDIAESYRAGANSYIVKPVTSDKFVEAMRSLKGYWFETVALPA